MFDKIIDSLINRAIAWGWSHFAVNAFINHWKSTGLGLSVMCGILQQLLAYVSTLQGPPDMLHITLFLGALHAGYTGINGKDGKKPDIAMDENGDPIPKALPA